MAEVAFKKSDPSKKSLQCERSLDVVLNVKGLNSSVERKRKPVIQNPDCSPELKDSFSRVSQSQTLYDHQW